MGELADAMVTNQGALERVADADLPELVSVLREIRADVRRQLTRMEADSYNAHRARALYVQVDKVARKANDRVETAFGAEVRDRIPIAAKASVDGFKRMVRAGEREFPGSVRPLRIDVASVLARAERSAFARLNKRANALGDVLERDIRRTLMSGIIRGETVDEMASRVLRGTGLIRKLQGDPGRQLDAIVDAPFGRARSTAEMYAQTELVNAYNTVQADEIREANLDDPGYVMKWDAAIDRVCPLCVELDGELCEIDGVFPGGIPYPPRHWRCRCAVVAWRREWKL